MTDRKQANREFEDSIRAAHALKSGSATVDISDREVSVAAKGFNAWVRGEGAPGAGEDVHEDSIDDASTPSDPPSAASEGFARWAGAVTDDDDEDDEDGEP